MEWRNERSVGSAVPKVASSVRKTCSLEVSAGDGYSALLKEQVRHRQVGDYVIGKRVVQRHDAAHRAVEGGNI
jgi:hypothetical protein